jgi:hypothetical protein
VRTKRPYRPNHGRAAKPSDTKFYGLNDPLVSLSDQMDLPAGGIVMSHKTAQQLNRVTAVFEDAAISFYTVRETTLAQLAEQLGALGQIHGGLLLPVNVRVAPERAA